MELPDIKSMLLAEIEEHFPAIGEKKYRALQVFTWLHKGAVSFEDMTDLPQTLRNKLAEQYYISVPEMADKRVSKDGTVKYLWKMRDGECIESVLLDYKHGMTVCISTQAGCRMGCIFCASAIGGLVRNLTPGEMLDQVLFTQLESGSRISNVVLMGIGEPLDNYDNVMQFIQLVTHPKGLNIGARHLTLSTCGNIINIDRLSDSGVKLSLAISLHAPDDATRTKLVPCNAKTSVKAVFEAANRYSKKTGRRVTFEYAMIDSVNDSTEQAQLLSGLLRGSGSHLNLIMLSRIPGRGLCASRKENIDAFCKILTQNGISFTTRRSLGEDIEAACGQLRRKNS